MTTFAIAVTRGCGRRIVGGVYAETAQSPNGQPVEHFLLDPPVPIELDVAPQGISWVKRGETWHIVDWVGESHYPNVADFIEEIRHFGLSRRIPTGEKFERITVDSRILLVHSRAIIHNRAEYRNPEAGPYACPKHNREHEHGNVKEMCAGLWWEDLEDEGQEPDKETGAIVREMPSFKYAAFATKEGVEPVYESGFFASFPIGRLAIVNDPDDPQKMDIVLKNAGKSHGLPVEVVNE